MPSVEQDPFHRIYLEALSTGRSFPTVRLLGSIKETLNQVIANIWAKLFANPAEDIDACLHNYLDPLAQRMNMKLGS